MRSRLTYLYLFLILLLISVLNSCDKIIGDDTPPEYTNGKGEIGEIGGIISVDDPSSTVNGIFIEIPENALSSSIIFQVSAADENIVLPFDSTAVVYKMEPEGTVFNVPVNIEFPIPDGVSGDNFQAWNVVPESQEVRQIPAEYDEAKNVLIATTTHFSYFAISNHY